MENEIDWFEEWIERGDGWVENDENFNKVFGKTAPEGFKKWYIKREGSTEKFSERQKSENS